MKNAFKIPQLFLRLALAIGFALPVMDRLGWLGAEGGRNISWGNWDSFIAYTNTLLPFLSKPVASLMGILATIAESLLALLLLIGYKTRLAAVFSFLLTLTFALCMAIFSGFKAPFNYSVFADSAGSLLLTTVPVYTWSIDKLVFSE